MLYEIPYLVSYTKIVVEKIKNQKSKIQNQKIKKKFLHFSTKWYNNRVFFRKKNPNSSEIYTSEGKKLRH
jgi:hypothetical protein